jgi:hypothetical protein
MERKLNMERFRMASISSSNNEASYPWILNLLPSAFW